jgi:nitronate monooxygenase
VAEKRSMDFTAGSSKPKAWKDIWGAGQGVGQIDDLPPTADIVRRLGEEYQEARERLARLPRP